MKKIVSIIACLFVTGCGSTVYVTKVPEVPEELKQPCQELGKIEQDASTKDAVMVISDNYSKYHECSDRVDNWIYWYGKQKDFIEKNKLKLE